jgi:GNAT superfamily N-acetyltransferase
MRLPTSFLPDAPPPSFEADLERWQRWLGPGVNEGKRVYVARVHYGKVVGVVLAAPDPDERTAGHLARLYVHPDYWGQGIGTRLYDAAIADLSSRFRSATL